MSKQREGFTGRQITVVVAAVCATVVAMPVAVYAAASVVNIGDPYSGSRARVFSGKLQVGDGLGPVTVDGIVNVKPPAGNYSRYKLVTEAAPVALYDIPANAGLAITTFTAAHEAGTGPVLVRLQTFTPAGIGDCSPGGAVVEEVTAVTVPADDTRGESYSPGLLVPRSTEEKCLAAYLFQPSGSQRVAVTITGFRF